MLNLFEGGSVPLTHSGFSVKREKGKRYVKYDRLLITQFISPKVQKKKKKKTMMLLNLSQVSFK